MTTTNEEIVDFISADLTNGVYTSVYKVKSDDGKIKTVTET